MASIANSLTKAAHSVRKAGSTHSTTTDHINNARKCFAKIRNKSAGMKEVGSYLDKAFGFAGETSDHATLASHHLGKAMSSIGQDLGPAENGDGYDASRENVQRKPVDIMTEGLEGTGDPTRPYPGKALTNPLGGEDRILLKASLSKSLRGGEADSIMKRMESGEMTDEDRRKVAAKLIGRKSWFGWGPGGPLTAGH